MWNLFKKRDKVMMRLYSNQHVECKVKWCNGIPFAAPYSTDTAARLLPGGTLVGQSYIIEWFPITGNMQEFYSKGGYND